MWSTHPEVSSHPPPAFAAAFGQFLRLGLGQVLIGVCSAGHRLCQHNGWVLFIHELSTGKLAALYQSFALQGALVSSPSVDSQVRRRKHMWSGCTQRNTKRREQCWIDVSGYAVLFFISAARHFVRLAKIAKFACTRVERAKWANLGNILFIVAQLHLIAI